MQKKWIGNKGEDIATHYLLRNGFTILKRNWRAHPHEIDIIALQDQTLHFIEVKTSTGQIENSYIHYFRSSQFKNIIRVAEKFMNEYGFDYSSQIDAILVHFNARSSTLWHKENVIIPGFDF